MQNRRSRPPSAVQRPRLPSMDSRGRLSLHQQLLRSAGLMMAGFFAALKGLIRNS